MSNYVLPFPSPFRYARAMRVFLDTKHLADGRNFMDDFAASLLSSLVVTPIVSPEALHRMVEHDPDKKDHVLMEWILALESFYSTSPSSRVTHLFPILFGNRQEQTSSSSYAAPSSGTSSLFDEGVLDSLSTAVPTATIEAAIALLRSHGIEPRAKLLSASAQAPTVRSIVQELTAFQSVLAWAVPPHAELMTEIAHKVHGTGQAAIHADMERQQKQQPREEGVAPTAAATATTITSACTSELDSAPTLGDQQAASSAQGGAATSAPTATSTAPATAPATTTATAVGKRTIKQMAEELREQFDFAADMPMQQMLAEALQFLGDAELTAACEGLKLAAKAEAILDKLS